MKKIRIFLTLAYIFIGLSAIYWLAATKAPRIGFIPGIFGIVVFFLGISLVWEKWR